VRLTYLIVHQDDRRILSDGDPCRPVARQHGH